MIDLKMSSFFTFCQTHATILICSGQSDGGNISSNNSVVERANSCGFGEVALILLWSKRWRGYQFKRFVLEESEEVWSFGVVAFVCCGQSGGEGSQFKR